MQSSRYPRQNIEHLSTIETRERVESEPLLIDRRLFEVWFNGTRISLTATEYDLLEVLHREHERVLSRPEILRQVWGEGKQGLRVVDTYVSRLRTKLKKAGHPGVHSVRKRGYRLAGMVGH